MGGYHLGYATKVPMSVGMLGIIANRDSLIFHRAHGEGYGDMGEGIHPLRSRLGVAIIGAFLIGGIAAALGAGSAWHPGATTIGGLVQVGASPTLDATLAAEVTPTGTAQSSPTTAATVGPTATPNLIGSTVRGTVVSIDSGGNSFIMSRNGTRYTILVDQNTTYGGVATQFSDLQPRYRVSVTITAQNGSAYLASRVSASIDN